MRFSIFDKFWSDTGKQIDRTSSIIWTRRWRDPGDFELTIPMADQITRRLETNQLINNDELSGWMMVEKVRVKTDLEQGDFMTISGRSIEQFLSWLPPRGFRLLWKMYGSYNDIIAKSLSIGNAGQLIPWPVELEKNPALNGTVFGADIDIGELIYGGQRPGSAPLKITPLDVLQVLSRYNIDFGFSLDRRSMPGGPQWRLITSTGSDKSGTVVFSRRNNNLLSSEYTVDVSRVINEVYCTTAQNPGPIVYNPSDGIDHSTVNSRIRRADIMPELQPEDVNWESTCTTIAEKYISEHKTQEEFACEVDGNAPYQYGKDYFLGDIVGLDNGYGQTFRARVEEMTYVEDSNGIAYHPTLVVL